MLWVLFLIFRGCKFCLQHSRPVMTKNKPVSVVNDPQARATVAIRALENAIHHLEDVSSLIIGEDIFD